MADLELSSLLEPHEETLREMGQQLAAGEHDKLAGSAAALAAALATGNPLVALLAPFASKAVASAFGNATDAMLRRELAALEQQEAQKAFVAQIADAVEVLLGQAILQIVRTQHRVTEALEKKLAESLGGLRDDLAGFREQFREQLGGEAVRVGEQVVRAGATGVRVGPQARKRVFIARMEVSGAGSIGIDLR